MSAPSLILASRSPRRRQLLAEAGYTFRVVAPDDDAERGICSECSPAELVAESAYRKAAAVRQQLLNPPLPLVADSPWRGEGRGEGASPLLPLGVGRGEGALFRPGAKPNDRAIIVAADTVAECDGEILGKPRDECDARAMLQRLSGRPHRVLTGVCLWPLNLLLPPGEGKPLVRVAITKLEMDHLTDQQLDDYLAGGQWEGKAGAFGYQDGLDWVHVVEGSESNVVGLPMEMLAEMLTGL
jgi:septum formation protein